MNKLILLLFIPIVSFAQSSYDLQGHRGARGLMPENSIPGMIKALDLGVNTLELDVVITKDGEVVVSHEPWMNPVICTLPNRDLILENGENLNLYKMTYAEIKQFDCGSKSHPSFPEQANFHVSKPLLKDLIGTIEKYVRTHSLPLPNYNIEIKSSREGEELFHPSPNDFSDIVYQLLEQTIDWDRVNIQSFDFRVLKYFHQTYPEVKLAVLVDKPENFENHLEDLGFIPQIYSPYFTTLDASIVKKIQSKGMKVIPWTVNAKSDMQRLLKMKVDGIITDYPNLAPRKKK
jgi:glycerophosphoryl diester phosphodiesterase